MSQTRDWYPRTRTGGAGSARDRHEWGNRLNGSDQTLPGRVQKTSVGTRRVARNVIELEPEDSGKRIFMAVDTGGGCYLAEARKGLPLLKRL